MESNVEKAEPRFVLTAGEIVFFKDSDLPDLNLERWTYLTEEEYRFIIKYLRDKGAIDEAGDRIDGKADETQHP